MRPVKPCRPSTHVDEGVLAPVPVAVADEANASPVDVLRLGAQQQPVVTPPVPAPVVHRLRGERRACVRKSMRALSVICHGTATFDSCGSARLFNPFVALSCGSEHCRSTHAFPLFVAAAPSLPPVLQTLSLPRYPLLPRARPCSPVPCGSAPRPRCLEQRTHLSHVKLDEARGAPREHGGGVEHVGPRVAPLDDLEVGLAPASPRGGG